MVNASYVCVPSLSAMSALAYAEWTTIKMVFNVYFLIRYRSNITNKNWHSFNARTAGTGDRCLRGRHAEDASYYYIADIVFDNSRSLCVSAGLGGGRWVAGGGWRNFCGDRNTHRKISETISRLIDRRRRRRRGRLPTWRSAESVRARGTRMIIVLNVHVSRITVQPAICIIIPLYAYRHGPGRCLIW